MFRFIKTMYLTAMTFFSCNAIRFFSVNNKERKIRPKKLNIYSDVPSFYLASIFVNKCSNSCNNINDPYSKSCVPDVVKNMNVKVFNLISRTTQTWYISWHETCKYKCKLAANVCNNQERWNNDKHRCEWQEVIDKGRCGKGYIWNPSICECKCNRLYDDK